MKRLLSHNDLTIIKRILSFGRPHWKILIVSAAIIPVAAFTQVAQPLMLRHIIDTYLQHKVVSGLFVGCALYFGLFLAESIASYAHSLLASIGVQRILRDIRLQLFAHCTRLPLGYFDKTPVGRLVSRVTNDVQNINDLFVSGLVALAKDLTVIVSTVCILLWMNVKLALFTFVVVPVLFLIASRLQVTMRESYRQVRRFVGLINGYLAEAVTGMVVIKLFQHEKRSLNEFNELNQTHMKNSFRAIRADATLFAVVEAFSSITIAAIIWFGGRMIVGSSGTIAEGAITFGTLVAFIEYLNRFFTPLRELSGKISIIQSAIAAGERVVNILELPVEQTRTETAYDGGHDHHLQINRLVDQTEPLGIRIHRLTLHYHEKDPPVLSDVTVNIDPGERLALVGPTGGGKSSLARVLLNLYPWQSGQVELCGRQATVAVDRIPFDTLRGPLVAMVPQDIFTFDGSAAQNVALSSSEPEGESRRRISEIFDLLQITHHFRDDIRLGEKGIRLSAGQRQLLAFARVLYFNPKIIILDEATSAIDAETEQDILRGMETVLKDRTALIIAHRLSTLQNADRIGVIHKGRLEAVGTHAALMKSSDLYRALAEETAYEAAPQASPNP